jgi:WD40 repeat protein
MFKPSYVFFEFEASIIVKGKSKTKVIFGSLYFNNVQGNKPLRTSSLLSPIMLLEGHKGEILCSRFSPNGEVIASAGSERSVCKGFISYIYAVLLIFSCKVCSNKD